MPALHTANSTIKQWGNGLAVRISNAIAEAAGVKEGTQVRVTAQKGQIIVEAIDTEPTLEAMLAAFDPTRHGGEVLAFAPVGKEML